MFKHKFLNIIITFLMITSMTLGGIQPALADSRTPPSGKSGGGNLHGRPTPAERQAAAKRLQAAQLKAGILPAGAPGAPEALMSDPNSMPDYFGSIPNYANSPLASVDPLTGLAVPGTGMQKFVDSLPQLTPAGINDLLQYLPEAQADIASYPGSDYYEIALVQYSQKMHRDLPATTLRGYVQIDPGVHSCTGALALHYVDVNGVVGASILDSTAQQVCAKDPPQYLGPIIVAKSYDPAFLPGAPLPTGGTNGQPTRIKFTNYLPLGTGGNLFLPTDTTAMGAGMGPSGQVTGIAISAGGTGYTLPPVVTISGGGATKNASAVATLLNGVVNTLHITDPGVGYTSAPVVNITRAAGDTTGTSAAATLSWIGASAGTYAQNRATLHLHGGVTPWISDGTPHQWTTPANENTPYPEGVSVENVPDMPDPGAGSMTFFYTNQQSARLMFYHDHAYGITRLNVYGGAAAGYLLTDQTEQNLISAGTLPDLGIPLVIQDKTYVPPSPQIDAEDPTWDLASYGGTGNLWFPHVYMPNQNPFDMEGVNAMGRWDYGPWFWPPYTGLQFGPVANPLSGSTTLEGPVNPGTPHPSMVPEGFMDTPVVNGTAYPTLNVPAGLVRFRILNAANDRMWNLQLYQTSNIVAHLNITNPGSGYSDPAPVVTITANDTTGTGATAIATVDTDSTSPYFGQIIGLDLWTVGSGYTVAPTVTIAAPVTGTQATATATLYTNPTEVGMVPFTSNQNNITPFPSWWFTSGNPFTLDDRNGGVPDPRMRGPAFIQIGSEGGVLANPAVIKNQPVNYVYNRRDITVLSVAQKALMLGPAERADVLVDFSKFAGKTLILYNDAPAPMPASDPRNDYFTGDPNQTSTGGAPSTPAGYGPNTRTIMQIVVGAGATSTAPVDDVNAAKLSALQTAIPTTFKNTQPAPVVPEAAYNAAYGTAYTNTYVRISDNTVHFTPAGGTPLTMDLGPKAIQELFTVDYGRMNATLGVELPNTNATLQTTIPFGYIDPGTELLVGTNPATAIGTLGDGTQIWKITHNGVDTHAIHFHLFNVQLINRVGWDGAIRPPDANEIGWKDTVRMSPLEDAIVALRPLVPQNLPFLVPNSTRLMDVTQPVGNATGFFGTDPNGNPSAVTNQLVNYGWEYVWHCHLLGHEENDMMRPMLVLTAPNGNPTNLAGQGVLSPLSIVLTWTNNATNATGYWIQRATDAGFLNNLNTFTTGNLTTYTDTTVVANTGYYYRVLAVNTIGGVAPGFPSMTAYSGAIAVNMSVLPAAPSGVAATLIPGAIRLSWNDNATNEAAFDIVRKVGAGAFAALVSVPMNPGTGPVTYTDVATQPGISYTYGVRARNVAGSSAYVYSLAVTTANPPAPTVLTGTLQAGPQIRLVWTDNSTTETGFAIERSINGGAFAFLILVPPHAGTGSTNYTDLPVLPGTSYRYRVSAQVMGSYTAFTNTVTVNVPTLPLAPSGLTVVPGANNPRLNVAWTDNANNETGFVLQRSVNGGAFTTLANLAANTVTYQDNAAAAGNTYAYRVAAINLVGSSAYSNIASMLAGTPAAPTTYVLGFTRTGATDSANLSWVNVATNATSLEVTRATNAGFTTGVVTFTLSAAAASQIQTGLTRGVHYYFRIRAVNGYGNSAYALVNAIAP